MLIFWVLLISILVINTVVLYCLFRVLTSWQGSVVENLGDLKNTIKVRLDSIAIGLNDKIEMLDERVCLSSITIDRGFTSLNEQLIDLKKQSFNTYNSLNDLRVFLATQTTVDESIRPLADLIEALSKQQNKLTKDTVDTAQTTILYQVAAYNTKTVKHLAELNASVADLIKFVDVEPGGEVVYTAESQEVKLLPVLTFQESPSQENIQILQFFPNLNEWGHHSWRPLNHPDIAVFISSPGFAVKYPDGRIEGIN